MTKKNKDVVAKISKALEINGKTTKNITIREPLAGELRGLKLLDVAQLDTNSLVILIPRITGLSEFQLQNMPLCDILTIGTEITGFLVPAG